MRFVPASRPWRWRVGAMAMAGVITGVLVASRAPAANTPAPLAAPTIQQSPANPTSSSSATFTFVYAPGGNNIFFRCSLDGNSFSRCSSPVTYTGLSSATHRFQIAAQFGANGDLGLRATKEWVVDRVPPTVAITFPNDGSRLNGAAYATGCAPTGICGTASDATSVTSVKVSVQSAATGRYWNGSDFSSSAPVLQTATGSTMWKFPFIRPVDGTYVARAVATDGLGNASAPGSTSTRTFMIDTAAPPAPTLTTKPDDASTTTSATFSFTTPMDPKAPGDSSADHAGVRTLCALDGAAPSTCESPKAYKRLGLGQHCFNVFAEDRVGNRSAPTSYCWYVATNNGFTISGNVSAPISPGRPSPVDVKFANPFPFALKILSLTATVTSNKAACPSSNFRAVQIPVGALNAMSAAPPGGSSLATLNVAQADWLKIALDISPTVDQNACLGATFKITYTGTATKA